MAFKNSGGFVGGAAPPGLVPHTLFIRAQTSNNTSIQGAISYYGAVANERRAVLFRGDLASPKTVDAYAQFGAFTHVRADGLGSDYAINVWHALAERHTFPGTSTTNVSLNETAHTTVISSDFVGTTQGNRVGLGADVSQGVVQSTLVGPYCSAAVWNVDLSAAEQLSLFKGFSPRRIRPQSLLWYAPCVREMVEIRGSNALTDTGARTVEAHPRAYGM